MSNTLYYGDNLRVLREYIADESVDLIYLDPPFGSARNYNVLFKDDKGNPSEAQIHVFEDTWHWNQAHEQTYGELVTQAPERVSRIISAMHAMLGSSPIMAYLVMMAARLIELHRVLKSTGSLYLHCDPTASHYLKIVLDGIFEPKNFRSEIIWRRTNAHNKVTRQYGPIHDVILFYSRSDTFTFHPGVRPYSKAYIETRFTKYDARGRYQTNYLTGPGTRKGQSGQAWRGFNPTTAGRHWAIPKSVREFLPSDGLQMGSHEQLDALAEQGLIVFPQKANGQPMYKQYVGGGVPYQSVWAYQPNTRGVLYESEECIDEDVKYLEDEQERLGFETQKPLGLLARILRTSSNEGDVVLDPFCGCGTTIAAAQSLKRQWLGIDVTSLATAIIKNRMSAMYPGIQIKTVGEPADLQSAQQLAYDDRYQFQWWALSLITARPLGGQDGSKIGKKGSDRGIDGVLTFLEDPKATPQRVIVQVKSGSVKAGDIRDLLGTVTTEKAAIGVFITLQEPTRDMRLAATTAGLFTSTAWGRSYPRLQILTIADLLAGKQVQMPAALPPYKQAQRVQADTTHPELDF